MVETYKILKFIGKISSNMFFLILQICPKFRIKVNMQYKYLKAHVCEYRLHTDLFKTLSASE